jgi:hypothetical protein
MAILRRGQQERVLVHVPRFAALNAVVVRTVPGASELAFPEATAVPIRFLHRRRASVTPRDGRDRRTGTLLAVPGDDGRIRRDILHFVEAVLPLAAAPQRREHARIDIIRPVAMVPAGFQVGWLTGQTRNVSADGILVTGAEALEAGDRLRVRFELTGEDDLVDLSARVVRSEDRWGLRGLRLDGRQAAERERIVRFVFEQQRRALQALRAAG